MIGTNKKDAQETVDSLLADLEAGAVPEPEPVEPSIQELLAERGADHVTYIGWQAIDQAEVEAGEAARPPADQVRTVAEMVEAARQTDRVAG